MRSLMQLAEEASSTPLSEQDIDWLHLLLADWQVLADLAAADLVICQAGCISHSAYWLVKDHCKRTGKRCVYVDKPSASAFARGLAQSVQEDATPIPEETEA